ncbi:MAG: hypothetical protein IPL92_18180 [Saprospiraceae bacterium]|nr:hypothetical protein [Candidatus Opimibacter iunctus]
MKKLLFVFLALSGFNSLSAQTTAMDWTRIECSTSNQHHLFAELDSGYVIMIDYVMMNCAPCITATNSLRGIYNSYAASHPGKVKLYSVGFNDFTTCEQMVAWRLGFHFTHPVFEKGGDETIYYGGIGMPTIVVLGGGQDHKVYYNHFGYDSSEDPLISEAIDEALAESTLSAIPEPASEMTQLSVFPNPFDLGFTVNVSGHKYTHLVITDLSGRELYRLELASYSQTGSVPISAADLPSGFLLVAGYDGKRLVAISKVVKE